MRKLAIPLILVSAVLTSCAHAPPAPAAESPATPAGERLDWFLKKMNDEGGRITAEDAEATFVEGFLAKVPASQLVSMFRQIGNQVGKLSLESVAEQSPHSLVAKVSSKQGSLKVTVSVERNAPYRFNGLLIGPARPERERPASWEAIDSEIASVAPRTNLLAARIDGDRCETLREHGAAEELAIGSTFKLWVLLAASDAVAGGNVEWQTPISIRDDWKSLPSGVLQEEPAGTTLPLEQVAREMISISDNTATDHLLRTVGRQAVEAAMARTGAASAARNRPFLTTRELFLLKFAKDADRESWLTGNEDGRRAHLAGLASASLPATNELASWKSPRHIDTLEWFAGPADLCRTMVALRDAGLAEGSPVLDILGQNPGVQVDRGLWSYVGFKGGSEPGVLNLTFLLRRAGDDAWYFFSVGANDPEKGIDADTIVAIAEGALDLLGKGAAADSAAPTDAAGAAAGR